MSLSINSHRPLATDIILSMLLSTAEETEKKPPINISFEIPYFTVSGIQVRYLKIVEKSGYQALPWVRYITQNGGKYLNISNVCPDRCYMLIKYYFTDYQMRMPDSIKSGKPVPGY